MAGPPHPQEWGCLQGGGAACPACTEPFPVPAGIFIWIFIKELIKATDLLAPPPASCLYFSVCAGGVNRLWVTPPARVGGQGGYMHHRHGDGGVDGGVCHRGSRGLSPW